MIIVRSPLRITLGGGGTDLPAWYRDHGGALITAAISKYIYFAGAERRFDRRFWLSYSAVEVCERVEQVRNELYAKCLARYELPFGAEIHSISEVPGNSGLGSSGSFVVGLLVLLNSLCRRMMTVQELAETACAVEMLDLQRASGKQDQYAAAYGGIQFMELDSRGTVRMTPLNLDPITQKSLANNLLIYYSGITRESHDVLSDQAARIQQKADPAFGNMQRIQQIGLDSRECLLSGDLDAFGRLLHDHWEAKRGISDKMSTAFIDDLYGYALASGALGGKIMGAGGGGYAMFYVPPVSQVEFRRRMQARQMTEMDWQFDTRGACVLYAG